MSTYKIIKKSQFAYGPVTSRNGDKISIALLEEYDEAIVSQAYTVFEITDTTQLLPEYLMMWFRRPEFDRYARYKSHGSAREIFDWNEMCETLLPVPSPEMQRQLVNEYHVLVDRITINNRLIQKLEETAQAVYKEWVVDFEFPNADEKPYKSNGGEMVESEMGMIPKGWRVKPFTKIIKLSGGGTPDTNNDSYWNGEIPFFTPADVATQFPQVTIIQGIVNLFWNRGMRLAWQTAAKKFDYDYYIWLNDDVILFENALSEILYCSELKNNLAMVCGSTCATNNKSILTYGGRIRRVGIVQSNGQTQSCDC